MASIYSAYDQLAEILAKAEPEKILSLKASVPMQERLEKLLEKSREKMLSKDDKDELDHYLVLERLIRLSKIRAQLRLTES